MHFLMVTHGIGAAALSRNYVRWGCAALLSILISSAWPGSVTAAGGATGNEAAESRSSVSAVERLKLFEGDLKPRQWSNLFGVKTCTAKDSVLESWVCDDPAAGFMDADLAESGRISASELGQLRRRIAVRCLPSGCPLGQFGHLSPAVDDRCVFAGVLLWGVADACRTLWRAISALVTNRVAPPGMYSRFARLPRSGRGYLFRDLRRKIWRSSFPHDR